MDKTGTLTDGNFIVRNVINFTDETDILQIMAALEEVPLTRLLNQSFQLLNLLKI